MFVKPAPGRTVRDPHSMALLPADGREVNDSDPFWLRRVRDRDVIVEGAMDPQRTTHRRHEPAAHKGEG
jgi:hypothetical protein